MITYIVAKEAGLPQLPDLLAELFTLESDFYHERRKQLCGLRLILANSVYGQLFVARDGVKVVAMANVLISISTAEGGRALMLGKR